MLFFKGCGVALVGSFVGWFVRWLVRWCGCIASRGFVGWLVLLCGVGVVVVVVLFVGCRAYFYVFYFTVNALLLACCWRSVVTASRTL